MKHARRRGGISNQCLRAVRFGKKYFSVIVVKIFLLNDGQVEDLLRATDAASDWQVDLQLKEACSSVVETACKNRDTNTMGVMSCLMDK